MHTLNAWTEIKMLSISVCMSRSYPPKFSFNPLKVKKKAQTEYLAKNLTRPFYFLYRPAISFLIHLL